MGKQNLETMSGSAERPVYSFDEAVKASTKYFNGDELAATVWTNKYALKDSRGSIYERTPDEMHRRLASELARIEKKYDNPLGEEQIYGLLKDFRYIVPQGGPMTGIGNDYQIASLSNCFVIGNEGPSDSYGAIMKIDQEQVQLMKRRGGVGHDLSHIRPKGSPVLNSALTSTGVVPFMERYSNSTREVAQDGRRGALMLSISVAHPDSEDFIDAKLTPGKITGANVSVRLDDDFMKSVKYGTPYVQKFPVESNLGEDFKIEDLEFDKLYRGGSVSYKKIDAQKLWEKIVHNAWKSAEPGILFWDTVSSEAIPDSYAREGKRIIGDLEQKCGGDFGKLDTEEKETLKTARMLASYETVSTNPCGEIPLCPYDSCRLLAINLNSYVENSFTDKAEFNFPLFKEHVQYAQRLMDDIIDLELEKVDAILNKVGSDPEEQEVKRVERKLWQNIRNKADEGRRTGVGITAEGDMLASLGLRYGSKEGNGFSAEVHKTLAIEAYRSSVNLAKERGAFKFYDAEIEKCNPFIQRILDEKTGDPTLREDMEKYGRRNISLLTIAPTGTTSLMTQTTSGIEPVFLPVYKRRRKVNPNDKDVKKDELFVDEVGDSWEEYNVFHHGFVKWLKVKGYNPDEVREYDDEKLQKIVEKSPYYKATSNDVNWMSKVDLQGRVQEYVDHSISVTINLPKDVSEDLVGKLYMNAWEKDCKGVTVYRDGSRSGVLISGKDKKKGGLEKIFPDKRPDEVKAIISRFKNENGNLEDWVSFTGVIKEKPYETFTGKDEEDSHVPSYVKEGTIIKTKNTKGETRYDFKYTNRWDDEVTLPGISNAFNPEFHNYAILFSKLLQKGTPINELLKTAGKMKSENESINSWINGFSRSLKPFAEGEEALGEKCDSCKAEGTLVYQEGCLMCTSCGSSKCG